MAQLQQLKVWVDADAIPMQIKDLISRAVHRSHVDTIFVANKQISIAESAYISAVQVSAGSDVADAYIAAHAEDGDLVVTQDIPLAAQLVPRGITVITPRGHLFTTENIDDCLSRRDLMESLREFGAVSGGPRPFDEKCKREFANHFDTALQRLK